MSLLKTRSRDFSDMDDEYASFRASVPLKKVTVEEEVHSREWLYFEAGPKNIRQPLVFLPPVSGGADVYFKQILSLSAAGFRVISVELPVFWNVNSFCRGFQLFLDALRFERVHLFGASLGGFLSQKLAETFPSRVSSLILCNSFTNTGIFNRREAIFFYWALPALVLKRIILGGFPRGPVERPIAESVDFMVNRLELLNQEQLAARMTLNCAQSSCDTRKIAHLPMTIINVMDKCALSDIARDSITQKYPKARRADLKGGGNFPFLSYSADVNLHIKLHLTRFDGTPSSARTDDGVGTP